MTVTKAMRKYATDILNVAADANDAAVYTAVQKALNDGKITTEKWNELLKPDPNEAELRLKGMIREAVSEATGGPNLLSTTQAFGGGDVNLLPASNRYATTKSLGKHVKTGLPVRDELGREVYTASELEHAKIGVFYKLALARTPNSKVSLNDHEKSLLEEIYQKDRFCGLDEDGKWVSGIPGERFKALLNDSTSGGSELVPEWFDLNVVTFPLLHSELFPHIDLVPVPRGASVEGASIGNPTVTWSYLEGTAVNLFNTAELVAGLNTTIHPVTCAVEVGRDLMSDAVANIGKTLEQNIGQRNAEELDRVIALGDGTSAPQGIFLASGVTTITPAGGNGAAQQVNDYESLLFGVAKQYRTPAYRCNFLSNDTTYSRLRGIPISASDVRRVFGMSHEDYTILNRPYRIQNDIANTQIAFGALAKYRMYRRQGQEVRWVTEDAELARKNMNLLIVRGRYGGRVVDGNAFTKITAAQA